MIEEYLLQANEFLKTRIFPISQITQFDDL